LPPNSAPRRADVPVPLRTRRMWGHSPYPLYVICNGRREEVSCCLGVHRAQMFPAHGGLKGVPYRGLVTLRGDSGHGGAAQIGLKKKRPPNKTLNESKNK